MTGKITKRARKRGPTRNWKVWQKPGVVSWAWLNEVVLTKEPWGNHNFDIAGNKK